MGETMAIASIDIARDIADFAQVVNVLRCSVHIGNPVRIYTSRSFLLRSLDTCQRSRMETDLYDHFVRGARHWKCWRRVILEIRQQVFFYDALCGDRTGWVDVAVWTGLLGLATYRK